MSERPTWWPPYDRDVMPPIIRRIDEKLWDAGVAAGARAAIREIERMAYDVELGEPLIVDREEWNSLKRECVL